MIAVRIAPDMHMAVVGSSDYFSRHPRPLSPQDLTLHDCIGLRLASHGGLLEWEFTRLRKTVNAHVTGRLFFNSNELVAAAALSGNGLAWLPRDAVEEHVAKGRLLSVLDEWATTFTGYYASRRASPALMLVAEALRPPENRRMVSGL